MANNVNRLARYSVDGKEVWRDTGRDVGRDGEKEGGKKRADSSSWDNIG